MGCGSSRVSGFTIQYCSLTPLTNKEDNYRIDLIAQEKIKKIEGIKLLDQCGKNDLKIKEFLEEENFKENTIFYYFLREKPILKSYSQSLKYQPFSLPKLFHIIILSTNAVGDIPIQFIEKQTKNLIYSQFIGKELNFQNIKKKINEANNPNITKDSINLENDTIYEEDKEIKEKYNEIIICGDLDKKLLDNVKFKFNNLNNINSYITKNEEENQKEELDKDNNNINTIKIFSCKIDNLYMFNKLMKYIQKKNIKKFYFYDNNINGDFDGWDSISEFLENNYHIRYIDLHCSNIYDNQLNSIIQALTDKRIRLLNLSENFISYEGTTIISSFLNNNKTLQRLNISRNSKNEFKAEGVQNILESLIFNPNIEYINFSYMNLTGCGVHIGNFLSDNKSLKTLILIKVQLNAIDFKNIFKSVKINDIIKEIDVSYNDMGGDKSLEYISNGIKENKSLNCLKIEHININDDNYQIIFDGIENNKNISSYNVNYNNKIKPKIILNFFSKQMHVKKLEYSPYDKYSDEDKNKELTLEEKKYFDKVKIERPDMKLINK